MKINPDILQKVADIAMAALMQIRAANVEKKADLAVRFARSQLPMEITLDGKHMVAVAVDIATVFSLEGSYHQIEYNGTVITAEAIQALSIVIVGDDVKLCKSSYDAFGENAFVNAMYWTTSLDALTERYIS